MAKGEMPTDAAAAAPARSKLPALAWWLLGGGVAVIAVVVALLLSPPSAPAPGAPAPGAATSAPSASASPQPAETGAAPNGIPKTITFAAGAALPANLQPGFDTTLLADPAWRADPSDTDVADGRSTFTHIESGCELLTYQTLATDLSFDPGDDYANSVATLKSVYGVDDIGSAPGSYFFDANGGASTVEAAAVLAQLETGEGELTTARGFGASNIALITRFTCPDAATTAAQFESIGQPTIAVGFVEG